MYIYILIIRGNQLLSPSCPLLVSPNGFNFFLKKKKIIRLTTIIHRQQFSIVDNNKHVSDEYTHVQEVSWLHEITIPPLQLADEHNHVPAPGG